MLRFFLVFCLFMLPNAWAQNLLKGIRYNATPSGVEITFDTSHRPEFEQSILDNPPRLVIDLANANSRVNGNLLINKGNVIGVRIGRKNARDLRLVIDLQKHLGGEITAHHPEKNHGHRLIANLPNTSNNITRNPPVNNIPNIQLPTVMNASNEQRSVPDVPNPQKNEAFEIFNKPQTTTSIAGKTERPTVPAMFAPKNEISTAPIVMRPKVKETAPKALTNFKNNVVVVLDAGHGGKDPGAISRVNGAQEKVVVLQIAKRIKKHLENRAITVFMTRNSDVYVPLRGRVDIARKHKADLFISIHADSAQSPAASGTSIYALSTKGATSQLAKYLENSENAVDLKWEVDVQKYDNDTQELLLSIQQEGTIESSLLLGNKLLDEISDLGKIHKNRVERANFVVLRAPEIPSILIETAFLSNPDDAELLVNPEHQERLAQGIARGIESYLNDHLPQHILLRR